jgi:hypothetical protein
MSQFKNSIMERQESKKSSKGLRSGVNAVMGECVKQGKWGRIFILANAGLSGSFGLSSQPS